MIARMVASEIILMRIIGKNEPVEERPLQVRFIRRHAKPTYVITRNSKKGRGLAALVMPLLQVCRLTIAVCLVYFPSSTNLGYSSAV